ncbi:hypothetical protein CkaCkLH20_05396 [Colletotrichum karsti]|uniref:Gylcosyl hydrolase 115 C-terminal domain-containing protein n=1 Tax=Colletotrichum karsti TaxID=1095194 RepID=A0A9P6I760_9PEZI|nr:uncharacterized protein CkaCkLH20_05396 [Colletotrichum karsti]KAF9877130.1 hypothetical protein CkaCkLH20_05396 [Colletotrichum karsti]
MKLLLLLVTVVTVFTSSFGVVATVDSFTITSQHPPIIILSSNEAKAVKLAAASLAKDITLVLGANTTLIYDTLPQNTTSPLIIVGTLSHSQLIPADVITTSSISGKWESYTHELVTPSDPGTSSAQALAITGSDRRGTVFGIYALSEQIGVSPWSSWANVPVATSPTLTISPLPRIQGPPSVKYRGIFINDEEQCLTSWAKTRFPLADSDPRRPFTSPFYARVFELILRLKANSIWPAMKYSMFYLDDANGELADDFGVVVGTSHHEPMARAYAEQTYQLDGRWDWSLNKDNITEFMRVGAERTKSWETLYTVGMRGEGDRESPTLTAPQLEEIISVQQDIIAFTRNGSSDVGAPQVWALYKEVGKYYQAGLTAPDDVTLLWTDDNFGNLLRIPYPNETSRAGGAGVYYHVNYVGEPKMYEWINTIQLVKTWEQMHLAWEAGAREVWIVNVGDIKPLEIPATHFLDMAYDMSLHKTPSSTTSWLRTWASKTFSADVAAPIAEVLNRYGRLVNRRKYETLNMPPFVYSTIYHDEATNALAEWSSLVAYTQAVYDGLPETSRAAFYEMILHPVTAGKTVNELYIKAELGKLYAAQRRTSTNKLAAEARAAFSRDAEITAEYNALNGGEWSGMMCQVHIGYTRWYEQGRDIMPTLSYVSDGDVAGLGIMGVAAQGEVGDPESTELSLLPMDPYMPPGERRWIDVFTRANGTFAYSVHANASWVSVSESTGVLSASNHSDARAVIEVDWKAAPTGHSIISLTIRKTDGNDTEVTALLPLRNPSVPEGSLKGRFLESNGIVSMEAAHFTHAETKNGVSYVEIPYYGKTLSGITPWPVTIPSLSQETAPRLAYDFYTFSDHDNASVRVYLGGSRNFDGTRPLKYAFAVDDGEVVTVQPVGDSPLGSNPEGWADSVITAAMTDSDELARGYTLVNDTQHNAGLFLLKRLDVTPGMRVLDVGCGPGDLTAHIANIVGPDGKVTGVDPSKERISLAQKKTSPNLSFHEGKAEDLSRFPSGSFDIVFVNSTFHWVQDQPAAVAEFARVLRPGGRLGMSGGSGDFVAAHEKIKKEVLSREPYKNFPVSNGPKFIKRGDLERLLEDAGFHEKDFTINKIVKIAKDGDAMINWLDTSSSGKTYGGVPPELQAKVREEMLQEWDKLTTKDGIHMDMELLVTVATRN